MIKLDVEGYCQQCLDFSPEVTRPERVTDVTGKFIGYSDTVIQCKYRKRCSGIKRYLEHQIKGATTE